MASIYILDSEPFTRDGIKSYISSHSAHLVVGEGNSGLSAIPEILALRPEILIAELFLNGLDGLEVVRRIHEDIPSIHIIVYTWKMESFHVSRAVNYGAEGFVLKNTDRCELFEAVDLVLSGRKFFSESISCFVDANGCAIDLMESLTHREREVLQAVAEGLTSPDISNLLYISSRTVEKHRTNLMKKLKVHSQGDLIKYALQRGLIPFHSSSGDATA